jgi:hypothetical protein
MAGIMLGPSLFGLVAPNLATTLFPAETLPFWVHPNFAKIPECDRQWLNVENDNQIEGRLTVLSKNILSKSLNS